MMDVSRSNDQAARITVRHQVQLSEVTSMNDAVDLGDAITEA
jgi:hypothetical protein